MYKVLIVDDERLIRDGLRTLIDWEATGFVVADAAADGQDALDKLAGLEPDLVIADIRMPGMSGLELMQRAQNGRPRPPRFVFLSGYADFEYAREALRLKAEGYLLKPVDEEELIGYLDKVRLALDEERSDDAAGSGSEQAADRPPQSWFDADAAVTDGGCAGEAAASIDWVAAEQKLLLTLDIGDAEAARVQIAGLGKAMLAMKMSEQSVKAAFTRILAETIADLSRHHPDIREREEALTTELFEAVNEERYSGMLRRLVWLAEEVAGHVQYYGSDQQVRKMIDMIHRNYAQPLKLETLAELLNYNPSYLGKLFKSTTGEPFNTYLDKVRIEKAKELLAQGMKVYEVAEQVGYANADYFHGKFRKYVGESPTAYRKKDL